MPSSSDPLRGALPGYVFDLRMGNGAGRYRHILADGRLGRLVSRDEIVGLLRQVSDASGERFAGLARAAVEGRISSAELYRTMQAELRGLYSATSALARGGWSQMTPVEHGRNGQILRGEYVYLRGLCEAIANGELTEAQAAARAASYAGRGYSRFWDEDQRLRLASGRFTEELWEDTKGPNECNGCPQLAAMGWTPIGGHGTVPGAGDTPCGGNCLCGLRYR
jgi:hypothetical protein